MKLNKKLICCIVLALILACMLGTTALAAIPDRTRRPQGAVFSLWAV